jgi:hypothetical protein
MLIACLSSRKYSGSAMDLAALNSHSLSRWSLPLAAFLFIYGPFRFMDGEVSPEIRTKLAEFLKGAEYEPYLGVLPSIVQGTFQRIFGARHFSKRCIGMSVILSLLSIVLTFAFTFLYAGTGWLTDVAKTGVFLDQWLDALSKNDNTKGLAQFIMSLGKSEFVTLLILVWVCWSVIPDYLALLKSRIVILVLSNTKPKTGSLFLTIIIDFAIASWVFLTSLVVPQTVLLFIYARFHAPGTFSLSALLVFSFLIGGLLFAFEGAIIAGTGVMYFGIPIANVFWASMVPSIWLWAYIISAVITRGLISARPMLRRLIYLLDVTDHPIRSLGVIAGVIMAVLQLFALVVSSFV